MEKDLNNEHIEDLIDEELRTPYLWFLLQVWVHTPNDGTVAAGTDPGAAVLQDF